MSKKPLLAGVLILFAFQSHAAIEYIRIAGVASDNCGAFEGCPYTLADFGLSEGQFVYFDFVIATDADDPANPDSSFRDYFQAVLLEGTEVGQFNTASIPIAVTTSFPEGVQTQILDEQIGLALGTRIPGDLDAPFEDRSISNWVVGTELDLFVIGASGGLYSMFVNTSIADLTLVYRGDSFPPAVVPLPAAFWLLLSAVGALRLSRRKTHGLN